MNPKQIVFALAVAAVGLVVGGLWGSQQDPGYETTHVVMIDQVLRTEPYESGPRTAAFSTAMRQASTRDRAAEATGLDSDDFNGIFAQRVEDSSIVEVNAITSDRQGAADRISAMIEATLLELIDQERATEQLIIDSTADEIADIEAALDDIYDSAGVARGTNLSQQLEQDRFNISSAVGQLENLPEDDTYWVVRLPGDIVAYQDRIDAVTPLLDTWIESNERWDELDATSGDAQERLAELSAADTIATARTAVLEGTTVERSTRIAAGRWAAIVGSFGLVAALLFIGLGTVADRRRASVSRRSAGGSSAAAAS